MKRKDILFILISILFNSISTTQVLASSSALPAEDLPESADKSEKIELISKDGEKKVHIGYFLSNDGKELELFISFSASEPCLSHRLWHWDSANQIYVTGEEEEMELFIILSDARPGTDAGDLWIWRSARNSSSGYADDFFCPAMPNMANPDLGSILKKGFSHSFPDSGALPWFSRFFGDFVGDGIPRFYQRSAQGSAGDVKSSSKWKNQRWTIRLSRSLDTGNADDIPFAADSKIRMAFLLKSGGVEYFSESIVEVPGSDEKSQPEESQ